MNNNLTVTFRNISGKRKQLRKAIIKIVKDLDIKSCGWNECDFDIHPIDNPK